MASASGRLREMHELLPRKPEHRGWRSGEALMEHALERAKERRRREYDVFLSYRGRHEEAVKRIVRRGGGEADHRIRYFSAGELALDDEILSLQRRWHVLRILQRWIATASEFWVYDVGEFIELRYPVLHRIPQSRIEEALAGGTSLEYPRCGTGHTVSLAPPRFWWHEKLLVR